MTLTDKLAADEVVKRIEEIRTRGGNGSVELHMQGGQVRLVKTIRSEVLRKQR